MTFVHNFTMIFWTDSKKRFKNSENSKIKKIISKNYGEKSKTNSKITKKNKNYEKNSNITKKNSKITKKNSKIRKKKQKIRTKNSKITKTFFKNFDKKKFKNSKKIKY